MYFFLIKLFSWVLRGYNALFRANTPLITRKSPLEKLIDSKINFLQECTVGFLKLFTKFFHAYETKLLNKPNIALLIADLPMQILVQVPLILALWTIYGLLKLLKEKRILQLLSLISLVQILYGFQVVTYTMLATTCTFAYKFVWAILNNFNYICGKVLLFITHVNELP